MQIELIYLRSQRVLSASLRFLTTERVAGNGKFQPRKVALTARRSTIDLLDPKGA